MTTLPTGTVAMLFSDIEGSTGLLLRLGSAYADALDAHRRLLRLAWQAHEGTEMGTEGDSFFVVFPSAPEAVAAAAQAQRELAHHPWQSGEPVRVRMGIHTGNPALHSEGYVGKDVHRAARIASAAHGGQVVMSEATANLTQNDLPSGVDLVDLGSHLLKDIPRPEHLFQLVVEPLRSDFPPLRTVGAASSLPVPPTALVGRAHELEEVTEALGGRALSSTQAVSPTVRLLTMTGAGGAGKTRLALEVAHRLVHTFPDGVFFVPLATATTPDVMWTSITEALDLPPENRSPAKLLRRLAHARALLVLDNLEQLTGADAVVAQILAQAPDVTIIATSRRPLHIAAEHEHVVRPLDLPDPDHLGSVEGSEAVQLFVQQARRVRSGFELTADNAADIAALCRRLDGLPLALELAAARTKLLSPHALLARLHNALDLPAAGRQAPDRQRTLRDTIAWSEKLLTPKLRRFFHQLGVFSGGADLEAVAAVGAPDHDDAGDDDVLDLLGELVDASLLTVGESADGEPRVGMLQTVRSYARGELEAAGELDDVEGRHAAHFLTVAESLEPLLYGVRRRQARTRFDQERDNFRVALDWALPAQRTAGSSDGVMVGLRLCIALNGFWKANGYLLEAQRRLERGVELSAQSESPELAHCLALLARKWRTLAKPVRASEVARSALAMARRVEGGQAAVMSSLITLATLEWESGEEAAARATYEEAISLARESGDQASLHGCLLDLATFESYQHHFERAIELGTESLGIAQELGHTFGALIARHNIAWEMLQMGRVDEASDEMRRVIVESLDLDEQAMLLAVALDYAVLLAALGSPRAAVRLLGAADAGYQHLDGLVDPLQQDDRQHLIDDSKASLAAQEWDEAYESGRATRIEDALAESVGPPT